MIVSLVDEDGDEVATWDSAEPVPRIGDEVEVHAGGYAVTGVRWYRRDPPHATQVVVYGKKIRGPCGHPHMA